MAKHITVLNPFNLNPGRDQMGTEPLELVSVKFFIRNKVHFRIGKMVGGKLERPGQVLILTYFSWFFNAD